jgi:hypothetical protein
VWSTRNPASPSTVVFITPNEDGTETIWVVTEYNPASFHISFAWVNPGLVAAQISICLTSSSGVQTSAGHASPDHTSALIQYTYTGLSTQGNRDVERYDQKWFRHKMQSWETAINHYLQTGKRIDAAGWE